MLSKYDRFTRQFKIRRELEYFFVLFLFLFCLFVCFFFCGGKNNAWRKLFLLSFTTLDNAISLDDTKYKEYVEWSFFENFTIEKLHMKI